MSLDELYELIVEGKFFTKPMYNRKQENDGETYYMGRKHVKPVSREGELSNLGEVRKRLDNLFRTKGFYLRSLNDMEAKLGGEQSHVLFRGHKTFNPFIKDTDTKSPGDTVYWAKQPNNAITFAKVTQTGGTKGRYVQNILHKIYGDYYVGYLTIAYPKYPKALRWYQDFGVEDEKRDAIKYRQQTGQGIDYDKHKGSFDYPSYRMDGSKGYHRAETVLGPNDVTKVRTYIVTMNNSSWTLLNIDQVKRNDPELYKVLLWNRLS